MSGDGASGGGPVITGDGIGGGTRGLFLAGVSHIPMSILCLPGTMGGGGIPGPFFFRMVVVELVRI